MVLHAWSRIEVAEAQSLLDALCSHYSEHGQVTHGDGTARIVVSFGEARLSVVDGALHAIAESRDETGLAYVKMGVTSHVLEFASQPAPTVRWQGDGVSGVQPPFFRVMQVVSSRRITPHMQRLTLSGQDIGRFAAGGLHIRLVFPPRGRVPVWPVMGEDGMPVWPQGEDRLVLRVYTIRAIDVAAGTLDVDMVLHPGADTPGASFAETAEPGDLVGMTGPGGGFLPQARRILLLGDETALPAMARILENAAPDASATAFIEVDGPAEEQPIAAACKADIRYLHRLGAPAGTTRLLQDALESVAADGIADDLYIWAGCEFDAFKAIRRSVRKDLKVAKDRHLVAAYWRRGAAGDEARRGARGDD
ncbi:siderophore-interacting protein [Aureimonas altamirensis]|uniref:siderophore-interacting protein n=1 Tax=Aureimonas altamirensis TaxID=370622 RepID=UPI002036C580|nr:siderophore-interacting protein [Aureimonas altamirensis]MCM2504631.1 siderophore-interacting protein [Aureimonas altamirensis]